MGQGKERKEPPGPNRLGDGTVVPPGMTKSAFKKQRRKDAWDAARDERRAANRQKRREKVQAQRKHWKELSEEERAALKREKKMLKHHTQTFGANVVIDCAFDELMTDREILSMGSQLSFLYASYRRSTAPFARLILAGPSTSSILTVQGTSNRDIGDIGDGNSNKEEKEEGKTAHTSLRIQYQPNGDAVKSGYYGLVQQATQCGQGLSFDNTRLGKQMNSIGDAHWTRWKGVYIIKNGGIEVLWDRLKRSRQVHEDAPLFDHEGTADPSKGPTTDIAASQPDSNFFEDASTVNIDTSKKRRRKSRTGPAANTGHLATKVPPPLVAKDDVIYLTADADEPIPALEQGKTYIIGGIVDRNRYKNICLGKARSLGIRVARLPIDADHLRGKQMKARQVLTVNQVFDILLGWTEQYGEMQRRGTVAADEATDSNKAGDSTTHQSHPSSAYPLPTTPNWAEALVRGLPERKFALEQRRTRRQNARHARIARNGAAVEKSESRGDRGDDDNDDDGEYNDGEDEDDGGEDDEDADEDDNEPPPVTQPAIAIPGQRQWRQRR